MNKKVTRRQFIEESIKGAILIGFGGYNLLIQGCTIHKDYDLLIVNGIVYDGLGNPGKKMDIAIKGEMIFKIGNNLKKNKAKKVIDAKGLAIAPGFIDAHSHTDVELLVNPKAESKIRQGVTTEISGNCGYSPFPIPEVVFEEQREYLKKEYDLELNWRDINGFFTRLSEKGIALNYATLLGQGSLRGEVVGFNDRPPTEEELKKMRELIKENMKAGALGISTGLEYAPGSFAKTNEIIELCKVVSKLGGIYATHMRDEGDHLLEAIDEAIKIAREAKISLQISHLKIAYLRNWLKIDSALAKIDKAKKQGINILADRYPYIAGSTGLSLYFPLWARQGTTEEFIERLKNPALDERIRSYVKEQEKKLGSWDKVLICSVFTEKNKHLEGKNILEAAKEAGKEPYEFMRDLLIEEKNRVGMITFMMDEDNLKQILAHPLVVVGSDGNAVAPYGKLKKGKPHPRYYGTFPRILGKYVREEKILSVSQAIKKMTSLTAEKFGLNKRGQIKEGYFADLVIFNPNEIIDLAIWERPHQYSKGIEYVIVNGQIVIKEGEHTGALPGKILKKEIV
jgi:N-acyl-D-amino-acid deacylase